jgi:hypothetical protein
LYQLSKTGFALAQGGQVVLVKISHNTVLSAACDVCGRHHKSKIAKIKAKVFIRTSL